MSVYAQIYDSDGAFTIYEFPERVKVIPDIMSNLTTIVQSLIAKDPTFPTNIVLNEGSFLTSFQEIQRITGLLNEQSLSDQYGLVNYNTKTKLKFPQVFRTIEEFYGVVAVI